MLNCLLVYLGIAIKTIIMSLQNLINFIDRQTENGTFFPNPSWGEGIGIKEVGEDLVRSLSNNDWSILYLQLNKKSDFWRSCLIELLDEVATQQARQMIIHIALNGTEENFFDAMECIRDFRRDVSTYTWLKLQNRSTKIISKQIRNKQVEQ